ncbi:MAG TPA: VOC family protein [Roseomonas sp.]|nr:VOC family protein [Roseomonas sp.]
MFSHVTVGARDLDAAVRFYDAVLVPLGLRRMTYEPEIGWASWQKPGEPAEFYVCRPFDGRPATWGNGAMNAFFAPDRAAVDAAHAAGLAAGGMDEGAPGLRPLYSAGYYGAYLRDPDGNKLCVVNRKV